MSNARLAQLIDQAFDYRGYVTLSRHDGTQLVGFVYDRGPAHVEMFDEAAKTRIRLAVDDIASVELTGEDSAAKAQRIWERRKGSLEPAEAEAWDERPVLFVVALPRELRRVAEVLGSKARGTAVRGRIGRVGAVGLAVGVGGGAAQAVAAERPRLVISCGLAGGLDPSLESGDLVLASSVRDEAGEAIPASAALLRAARQALEPRAPIASDSWPRLAEGEILCATAVAASAQAKRALARPGRLAVDLESWSVAHAARRAAIPWLALRVVLDPLDTDLPAFTAEPRASYLAPALRHALRGPRAVAELARLALRARTAERSLERALHLLAPAVGALTRAEASP